MHIIMEEKSQYASCVCLHLRGYNNYGYKMKGFNFVQHHTNFNNKKCLSYSGWLFNVIVLSFF